ncbi:MAG: Ribosome-releasing factor 2, mitochondrial [Phylliscum demangeonii]|nr:MAG: Ribosome-releasing factor 2, mitochondrial [Phylliscum demangeonii]
MPIATDVDDGSTVTDFLPAERARGITIQSAAITFHWPPIPSGDAPIESKTPNRLHAFPPSHTINLIDTPGHADFTFEVLRSLRVLDGAICILDGVAGVEAQTEKVWQQASVYQIPRIIYINKLDRDGAAFGRTVREIGARLMAWPAVCQLPWWSGGDGPFVGVGDVVRLCGLKWDAGGDGKAIAGYSLPELERVEPQLARELRLARVALVELLSEYDDRMVEVFLEHDEDHLAIPASEMLASLRRCVAGGGGKLVPVFAGASFKNIGVQPLLDAVVDLLPSPVQRPSAEVAIGGITTQLDKLLRGEALEVPEPDPKKKHPDKKVRRRQASTRVIPHLSTLEVCALAFKVVNDARRGVLVYVRVYHGTLHRNAVVFNTNLQVAERAPRLLQMYAADAVEVASIGTGQIGVVVGLEHARTGDTLLSSTGMTIKRAPAAPLHTLQLRPIHVPPPVFFASLEPHSLGEEKRLHASLALLLREDPSLAVSTDDESGQTLLSGMGELHLEIARDRLVKDFKAKAEMGGIEIGHRECLLAASRAVHYLYDKEVAGKPGKAGCEAVVRPWLDDEDDDDEEDGDDDEASDTTRHIRRDGNLITVKVEAGLDTPSPSSSSSSSSSPSHLPLSALHQALINGALAALTRGPVHNSYAMHRTHVSLTLLASRDLFGADSSPAALTSAARHATRLALSDVAGAATPATPTTALMEPVMHVTIAVDDASLGPVMHDLSAARGAHVLSLDDGPSSNDRDRDSTATTTAAASDFIDTRRIYAPRDPFESASVPTSPSSSSSAPAPALQRPRTITARVPLQEMVGYLRHLRSLSAGRGSFVMTVDRFEKMTAQRERAVVERKRRGFC